MPKFASEGNRYGITQYEDWVERAFATMQIWVKRHQVICFICNGVWTSISNEYPSECWNCGTSYIERGMYMMPDIFLDHLGVKAVIYINGPAHEKRRVKIKDRFQIERLKELGYKSFTIQNEELDLLRHANRCFLALGIWTAIKDPHYYERAFQDEKELPH